MLSTFAAFTLGLAAASDLSGAWTPAGEPKAGPVHILDCYPNYMHYAVQRTSGNHWQVAVHQVYYGGPALPMLGYEELQGTFDGQRLHLKGRAWQAAPASVKSAYPSPPPQSVTYDLALEAASGHFVGIRNGEPFRLARLMLYKPPSGDCGPAPP